MIKRTPHILLVSILLWTASLANASNPDAFVQKIADRVTSALSSKKGSLSPGVTQGIIRRHLLPHVYINGMARAVLGRKVWGKIKPTQRSRFKKELIRMIERTYAKTLVDFNDEKVKVYPIRGGYRGEKRITIKSEVIRKRAPSIPLDYRLVRFGSNWKIYDMTIEGVSLLQNFKTQFSEELTRNSFEGLIIKMRKHNSGK